MKRIRLISLLLALLAVLCLTACSSKDVPASQTEDPSEAVLPTEAPMEMGEHGELIFDDSRNITLFENESCSFTLNKAEIDSLSDYNWDVSLMNRAGAVQIFTIDEVYVNDIAFDPGWACKVEGSKATDSHIIWTAPEMEARGITQITRVDFRLRIYPEGGAGSPSADQFITVYPSGRSAYIPQTRNPQTTDVVLLDNESYTLIATGFEPDNRWGYAVNLYLANKTGAPVEFSAESVAVSGDACSPQWACTLGAGKQGSSQMVWLDASLEEAGIEAVSGITFDLVVRDLSGAELFRDSYVLVP